MKADRDTAALPFDRRNAQLLADGFEDGVLQKVIHGAWRGAKAVFQLLANVLLFFFRGDGGNALVGAEAQIFAGDVVFGDAHIKAEAKGGTQLGRGFFPFQFGDGALQHLAIEVETDRFNVAVLLAAEHVAGAAELEVEGGDAEAGA